MGERKTKVPDTETLEKGSQDDVRQASRKAAEQVRTRRASKLKKRP